MRINSLITCSNGGRGGATLLQPTSKAGSIRVSRPKFPLNLIFIAHFPPNRKRVWAGFSPRAVSGEMGNGTSQFLPRSRRLLGAKPPTLLAQLHSNISGVKTATAVRRVSVYEQLGTIIIIGGRLEWMIGRCLDTDRGGGQSPDPHLSRHQPAAENGI